MENLLFSPPVSGTTLRLPGLPGGSNVAHDRSSRGNRGVLTGAIWQRLPTGLWYLWFDGVDDGVNCGNHPSLDVTDKLTVKLWVLPESQTAGLVWVVGKDGAGGRSFAYGMNSSLYLFAQHSGSNVGSSANPLVAVRWHHIAYVYASDAALFRFYINGVLDSAITSPPAISSSSTDLCLGRRSYIGAEGYYKGGIALVEIQHGIWSALEVKNSFDREKSLFGVW